MNKGAESNRQSVRQMLAARTRQAHETLHEHPWIASLLDPDLTIDRYCSVLAAYYRFYNHVEQACAIHDFPAILSLVPARDRLKNDLDSLRHDYQRAPQSAVDLTIDGPIGLLGALYVLHGSSFGATILNKNVRRVLPDAPRHFLGAGTTLESWQRLIVELEYFEHDDLALRKLFNGANDTFHAFGAYVTDYCESRYPDIEQTR